jgi:type IX secretion system PorP/SprF family membrane protein
MKVKNKLSIAIVLIYLASLLFSIKSYAQQMPFYTQYRNNQFLLNPAIAGTKRTYDARIGYRAQWVGYEGAPSTSTVSFHSRYFKGKLGTGIYILQDKIGPFKFTDYGLSVAYHIRFPDVELSIGLSGDYKKYFLQGDKISIQLTQDPAINQAVTDNVGIMDASAGLLLYNDRFHVGFSSQNLFEANAEFYKNDTSKRGNVTLVNHLNFSLGYNYAQNPDYVWESNFLINYVTAAPMVFDYTLRMHYKEKMFAGASIRLGDAIALHLGYTLYEKFRISYSYDLIIGKLRGYSGGTHEINLAFSAMHFSKKKSFINTQFLRQRYGYMF